MVYDCTSIKIEATQQITGLWWKAKVIHLPTVVNNAIIGQYQRSSVRLFISHLHPKICQHFHWFPKKRALEIQQITYETIEMILAVYTEN